MSELSISRVERVHRCAGCQERLEGASFDEALDCPRCGALAHLGCAQDAPRCTRCGEELAVEIARHAHHHRPSRARRLWEALVLFFHELRTRPLELVARWGTSDRGQRMGVPVALFVLSVLATVIISVVIIHLLDGRV